jgi:hypothetical protein
MVITHQGMEITLLTPASTLYQKLLGLGVGDSIKEPSMTITDLF